MGEFNYNKQYEKWNWKISDSYNIGYDTVDKHTVNGNKNKIALIWENQNGELKKFSFFDIKNLTNKFGNVLKHLGIKKGDRFIIRLPNIPEFQISYSGSPILRGAALFKNDAAVLPEALWIPFT